MEYLAGYIIKGKQARKGQISVKPNGPTDYLYTDDDAIKDEFQQQRGDASKGDVRALVAQGKVDDTTHVKQQIKKDTISSSFYGDET